MTNNNQNNITQEEDVIDLKELFFDVLRGWPIIFVCVLLSLIAAIVYLKRTKPVYSVNALVQVDDKSAGSDLLLGGLADFNGKSAVQTEIEIVKSRMILGQVISNLNLNIAVAEKKDGFFNKNKLDIKYDELGVHVYEKNGTGVLNITDFQVSDSLKDKSFEFKVINDKEYLLTLMDDTPISYKGVNGQLLSINDDNGSLQLDANFENATFDVNIAQLSLINATNQIVAALSATEKGKKTGILALSYTGTDKNLITNTLNHILNSYVAQNLAKKSAEKEQTLKFLDKQLPEIKEQLEQAEFKFNEFRNKNNTIDVNQESKLLIQQNIELAKTRLELEQKKAELSVRFTDEYPLLKQIDAQIDKVNERVAKDSRRLKKLPSIQQEYLKLYRDVEVNTQLYTNLLDSYQKLKIAKAGEVGNVRVIDKAIKPIEPIKPRKKIIVLLSLILGSFIGLALILLKKMFQNGIKDTSEIETKCHTSVLATIPRSESQRKIFQNNKKHHLLYIENNEDMSLEALRSLRTTIHFSMLKAKNNILVVTGASPNIGKSFLSANFVAVLASSDKSVLLIDADMRRGHISEYYGTVKGIGLAEYLSNKKLNIQDVMINTMVDGVTLLNRGKSPKNPSELLMSERFDELISNASNMFDYVIIDSPPILAVTDALILSEKAGATLVVARYDITNIKELNVSLERLNRNNANVLGVVFNDVQRQAGNNYSYQYGYDYKSK